MRFVDVRALGPPIGFGRTAEVFAYGDSRVVKLLRPGFPDRLAEAEARIAEAVAAAYPSAPRCDGLVRIDDRLGVVFERLDGPSMDVRVRAHLWEVDRHARALGTLHADMHARDGDGLRDQRAAFHAAIDRAGMIVPAASAAAAHERVDRLPAGSSLCHGDLHPANVLLGRRPIVIDWDNARTGSPAADVARSIYLLRDAAMLDASPSVTGRAVQWIRGRFCRVYLAAYDARRRLDRAEVAAWRLPVLVARLAEGIEAERTAILAAVTREMAGDRTAVQTPASPPA